MSLFMFLWLTDYTPHSLSTRPTKGRLSMALLDKVTMLERGPSGWFMKARMLAERTPWGWKPKRHLSF